VLLTKGIKSSLQRELDSFYKEVTEKEFNIRHVAKGSFSKARAKLNPEAFVELSDNAVNTFYSEAPYWTWYGMRVLSADGSRLVLPRHKSVIEEFGEHGFGPQADSPRSLALYSFLYDPLNLITIDSQLAPYASSERDLLHKHLPKIQPGDLILLDRGYPSLALMFELQAQGTEFCMRMKEDWWLDVKGFSESGQKEQQVVFKLPKKDQDLLHSYPQMNKEITCRLISIDLENGEKEILCTSLIDMEKYTYSNFSELYHFRWNIEEGYKLFKSRVEIEYFSGKTARAVKQDFFAKVFMMNLCAILAFPVEEKVRKESEQEKRKHKRKINRTSALSMTSHITVALFIKKTIAKAIQAFDDIVSKTLEIVRPNRKFERKKRPKRLYHMNYKRL
jgi:Transposase DDE domain